MVQVYPGARIETMIGTRPMAALRPSLHVSRTMTMINPCVAQTEAGPCTGKQKTSCQGNSPSSIWVVGIGAPLALNAHLV